MNAFETFSTPIVTEGKPVQEFSWVDINQGGCVRILCRNDLLPMVRGNSGFETAIKILNRQGAIVKELYAATEFSIAGYSNPGNMKIVSGPVNVSGQTINIVITLDNGFLNMYSGRV